jgi:hypothetical protein
MHLSYAQLLLSTVGRYSMIVERGTRNEIIDDGIGKYYAMNAFTARSQLR